MIRILYIRILNILSRPILEFKKILSEDKGISTINRSYLIPLSLLVAISSFVGASFMYIKSPLDSYIFILINTTIVFFMMFSQAYISGKLIQILGKNIAPENDVNYYTLAAYAQTALMLTIAFVKLFPSLIFMIFMSLYAGVIIYVGIPILTKIENEKRVQFTVLSTIILTVIFIASSELFSLLYSEIIDLF